MFKTLLVAYEVTSDRQKVPFCHVQQGVCVGGSCVCVQVQMWDGTGGIQGASQQVEPHQHERWFSEETPAAAAAAHGFTSGRSRLSISGLDACTNN